MAFRTNKMPVLQTKSASGSVATFNTALAMPLSSCNIDINAWQEGSGDPSPANNRPIHGFSVLNATRAGKNLFDGNFPNPSPTIRYLHIKVNNGTWTLSGNTPTNPYMVYLLAGKVTSGASGSSAVFENRPITVNGVGGYITIAYRTFADYNPNDYKFQLEGGNEATAYEPYVTPTIYPIQLGQEVYGAEVDVVNGVAHCTWTAVDMGDMAWTIDGYNRFQSNTIRDLIKHSGTGWSKEFWCEIFTPTINLNGNYLISMYKPSGAIYVKDDDYTTASDFKNAVTGKKLMFELAEPFDIQLTPTQIETLIGNNTIFADTGDVDLTYKDLDIAKRGNFREVFKLPS